MWLDHHTVSRCLMNGILFDMKTGITILHEDEHLVVINKPAGIIVHADGKREEPTIVEWFLEQYPGSKDVGEEPIETDNGTEIIRPGIVHRLDRDTSGVLVLCKTQQGHEHMKHQFKEHTTVKIYEALVYGDMKQDTYHVEAGIGRAKTFGRWTAIPKAIRGRIRDAETKIKVVDRFTKKGQEYTRIKASPKTGRTHQIRVHLQYLNHPIIADPLYAGKRNDVKYNLGFERQALHAQQLTFRNINETEVVVAAPIPKEFTNFK